MSQQILNPQIEKYLHNLTDISNEPVLVEMEKYGLERKFPIIGRLCGRLLYLVAASINAKNIFELGSGFGFSAYWFAKAVGADGKIYCTDGNVENKKQAEEYLTRAGFWNRINYQVGWAQEIFKKTPGIFDIVYNDIDKDGYPEAFELAASRVRPGGFYICDNTLWFGRVVEEKVIDDVKPGWTEAIKKHNEMVFSHPDFETSIIPLRDGLMIARHKN